MSSFRSEPVRFSIVTPSYNQLDYLSLATSSVRDQARRNSTDFPHPIFVEHIIQDPGSRGIDEFAKKQHAIYNGDDLSEHGLDTSNNGYSLHVNKEKDEGMYDAINLGFEKASGEILAYLNCDEQYLPGALKRVAGFFRDHPHVDMIFGDVILVNKVGRALAYRRPVLPNSTHTRLCHLGTLTCATFFRASLLQKDLFFDKTLKVIGDAEWMVRCLNCDVKMALLPEPLSVFSFTGNNLSDKGSLHAEREKARWRASPNAPPLWLKWPAILYHRILKFLAGAYQRRNLEYRIYTLNSPITREAFTARSLGSKWRA